MINFDLGKTQVCDSQKITERVAIALYVLYLANLEMHTTMSKP